MRHAAVFILTSMLALAMDARVEAFYCGAGRYKCCSSAASAPCGDFCAAKSCCGVCYKNGYREVCCTTYRTETQTCYRDVCYTVCRPVCETRQVPVCTGDWVTETKQVPGPVCQKSICNPGSWEWDPCGCRCNYKPGCCET